jgi:hypothetical protein
LTDLSLELTPEQRRAVMLVMHEAMHRLVETTSPTIWNAAADRALATWLAQILPADQA